MANRTAALLGQLFKYGIHRRIVTDTPVKLLYRLGGKEKPRDRALTDKELTALLLVEPLPRWERLHRAINLLLLTGQRRGELARAAWKEIDFGTKLWNIPADRTKTGKLPRSRILIGLSRSYMHSSVSRREALGFLPAPT